MIEFKHLSKRFSSASGAAESNDTKDIPICNGKVHILKGIYHA